MSLLSAVFLICLVPGAGVETGFAAVDITPEAGAEMPGGFGKNFAKGTHDRLFAVAMVVSDGTTAAALVGIDALYAPRDVVEAARSEIARATRIPAANVMVGASHTHLGGPIVTCFGSDADPAYLQRVSRAIAEAVVNAWSSRATSEIAIGTGKEDTIAFNRRFLMRDGREITHPGKPGTPHHAEIVRPAGPTDPDVGVLAVRKPGGAIQGVVVNFACHATVVGGNEFSADYIGSLRRHLQANRGESFHVVFLAGPCGDITQVDNLSTAREFGPEHSDVMGAKLAAETERVMARSAWLKELKVGAATELAKVAIRDEPDAGAERPAFGLGSGQDEVYARERKLVAEERARTPVVEAEVQAIRVGPLGIASNGAEYFVEHGLRIKAASRHPTTWVVSMANENLGYVPTAQAFVGGGYEPRTATSSRLAPNAGQRLVESALKALARLQPE